MKKTYIAPELAPVLLSTGDVIATSGEGDNYCLDQFPILSDPDARSERILK